MVKELFFLIFILTSLASFAFSLTNRVHMFQLSAYKYVFMSEWIKNNFTSLAKKAIFPFFALAAAFTATFFYNKVLLLAIGSILNIIFLILNLPKKAKKPLVFTMRVKRLFTTCFLIFALLLLLSTLLWKNGISLFVCQFALIFPSYLMLFANFINKPLENLVRNYYINQAKKKISDLPNLTVIGITGSFGKTGTKYILERLLSEKYNVLMTPASYNTTMGVVKVIRENLTPAHDIFICEMGARNVGEIKEICDIVKPKYGIITSIGACHLETFGSIENITKTKFELCDALSDDGIIFLNADNEYISNKKDISKKAIYYGMTSEKSDFTAQILSLSEFGTKFKVKNAEKELTLSTKLLGAHNVLNIAGCVALAKTLGLSDEELILGAKRIVGAPHRLSLIKGQNFVIIDDSFNSNPSGCRAALDVLSGFSGQKILITPGMIELGEKQEELNFKFGQDAAMICDKIFLIGQKQTKPIFDGISQTNFDMKNVRIFEKVEDAINTAKSLDCTLRNIILIENDLPDNFS